MELAAHVGNNVWDEAARDAREGCQENARGAQGPEHLRGSTGHRCQHEAARSRKVWHSAGKARAVYCSCWHLLLSVLRSFNESKACFACQASWLILAMALVKHKEMLDKGTATKNTKKC